MPDSSSYAVGWGALALINTNIAQLKGRRGINWFVASLFLGPLATFMLAMIERPATLETIGD